MDTHMFLHWYEHRSNCDQQFDPNDKECDVWGSWWANVLIEVKVGHEFVMVQGDLGCKDEVMLFVLRVISMHLGERSEDKGEILNSETVQSDLQTS